jgi:DNA-binding NarL/FixJ family response regulator
VQAGFTIAVQSNVSKTRVIIADDHPAFREGLSRLLEEEADITVVSTAVDGEEAVLQVTKHRPDVAVLDVTMPKLNGIEATKQIRSVSPETNVLIVSAHDFSSYILAALRAGAAGYILKTAALDEIINAVRLVRAGEGVFDLKAGGRILCRLADGKIDDRKTADLLYPREMEVLKLVAKGLGNKEIARELVISERTVHSHLINIFRKLEVGSRTEAVLHALKEGWLALEDLP